MPRIVAVLLATSLLPSAAFGAEPASASKTLAGLLMPKEAWSDGVDRIAKGLQGGLESPHAGAQVQYPADFPARVRAEVEAALPYDTLLGIHAKEISATFTEAEVAQLVEFQRSPVGQKSRTAMPAMQARVAAQVQQHIEGKMGGIMERLTKMAKTPEGGAKPAAPATAPTPAKAKAPAQPAK